MVKAKKAVPKTPVISRASEGPSVMVTKNGKCPTLNGKSSLEYAFGVDALDDSYLCVSGNDGGGYFSNEWVACADILNALSKADPVTSLPLRRLFQGKSVNTPGFLLAILLHEKLVARLPGKTKVFQLLDTTAFLDKVQALQGPTSKPAAKKAPAAKAASKKTPAKSARAR